jgi:hypothetical protein
MLGTLSHTSRTSKSSMFSTTGLVIFKIVEDIAMKKPKTVADLLAVADICIEASEAQARLLESHSKGPSRKKDDGRSTQLTGEIVKIIVTVASSPRIRRRRGLSSIPMTQRSGVRFTAP